MDVGWLMELEACTRRSSVELTSMMGGLDKFKAKS